MSRWTVQISSGQGPAGAPGPDDSLQGRPISATAPTLGQALTWDGSAWVPTDVSGIGTGSQYLLVDGTRALTGDLDLGGNNVANVGTVDGRDLAADGTKLDGIATGADVSPTTLGALNARLGVTLDQAGAPRPPQSHALDAHTAITLAELNALLTDATLDASSAPRTPTAHSHSIPEVSGLQASLDGKAASVHSHEVDALDSTGAASGDVPTADGVGGITWSPPPGSGGGEANVGGNVGGGADIYRDKVGTTLNFRGIAGTGGISVSVNGDNVEVDGSAFAAAAHTHTVSALDSTGASAGHVPTADGAGGVTWAAQSGGGGTSDHGGLTGLLDDDHTQYLPVAGTRAMSGALNMGGFAITNVGTVDGRDLSADGTKLDGIAAGADVTPTTLAGLNAVLTDATLDDSSAARPPAAHALDAHGAVALAALNAVVSDATLDDAGDARPPAAHALDAHSAVTLAALNAVVSDATLDDSSAARTPTAHVHGVSDFDSTGATSGDVPTADGAGGVTWSAPPGSGGGEANDGTNIGTGVGVYDSKTGSTLAFRALTGTGNVGVSLNTDTIEVDGSAFATLASPVTAVTGTSRTAQASDVGLHLYCTSNDAGGVTYTIPSGLGLGWNALVQKGGTADVTIAAGAGVTILADSQTITEAGGAVSILPTDVADTYRLVGAVGGERLAEIDALTPASDDVIQQKAGVWTNRTMAQLAADLDPHITGSGEANDATNVGGGVGVYAEKVGANIELRTLSGLGGIGVAANGDVIEIDGSGLAAAAHTHAVGDVTGVATSSLLGRTTAGTGAAEVLTVSAAQTLLNVADGADVTPATLSALNTHLGVTLDTSSDPRPPAAHALDAHSAVTLAELNAIVSDATLDDASDARTPTAHTHTVGDLDSTGASSGEVPTADGVGGVTWAAQTGGSGAADLQGAYDGGAGVVVTATDGAVALSGSAGDAPASLLTLDGTNTTAAVMTVTQDDPTLPAVEFGGQNALVYGAQRGLDEVGTSIAIRSGLGNGTGAGGFLLLYGGDADSAGDGDGGEVHVAGGDGGVNGNGARARLWGGLGGSTTGDGAYVEMRGGSAQADGLGGAAYVQAGQPAGADRDGANVYLAPSAATGAGADGKILLGGGSLGSPLSTVVVRGSTRGTNQAGTAVNIQGGPGDGSGNGAVLALQGGYADSGGSGDGGLLSLGGGLASPTGAGGGVALSGAPGGSTSGPGGGVTVSGGNAAGGSGDVGGSVTLTPGSSDGAADTACVLVGGPLRYASYTTAQRDALVNVPTSTTIWNSDTGQIERWNGSAWVGGATSFGSLTGVPADNTALQNALDAKANLSAPALVVAGTTRTLQASDLAQPLYTTSASAVTITLPSGLGLGFNCTVQKGAAGDVTISAGAGVTILADSQTITEEGGVVAIVPTDTADTYRLVGAVDDPRLAEIAALSPADDDFLQQKGGAWVNRTPAQVAVDLDPHITGGGGSAPATLTHDGAGANPIAGDTITINYASGWSAGAAQWTRNGAAISGANSTTSYTLVGADEGTSVTVDLGTDLVYTPTALTVDIGTPPGTYTAGMWSLADDGGGGQLNVTISSLVSGTIVDHEYELDASGTWQSLGGATTGTYPITGLTDGVSHDVRIRATNGAGDGSPSDVKTATPTTTVQAPSTILGANHLSTVDPSSDTMNVAIDGSGATVSADGDLIGQLTESDGAGGTWSAAADADRPVYRVSGGVHWIDNSDAARSLQRSLTRAAGPAYVIMGVRWPAGAADSDAPIYTLTASGTSQYQPEFQVKHNTYVDALLASSFQFSSDVSSGNIAALDDTDVIVEAWMIDGELNIAVNGGTVNTYTDAGVTALATDVATLLGWPGNTSRVHRNYGTVTADAVPTAQQRTDLRAWLTNKMT